MRHRYNKVISGFFIFLVILAFCILFAEKGTGNQENQLVSQSKVLKINIISNRNGVGLSRDIDILFIELAKLGHEVRFTEDTDLKPQPKTDINLFIQPANAFFLPFADKNYLIPNPEWSFLSSQEIAQFDLILCKTKEAERIFKPLNSHVVYLGFTSKDRLDKTTPQKNYKGPFHLAGASTQKGTEMLVKMWLENPQFPALFLIKHKSISSYPPASNLHLMDGYLEDSTLANFQNFFGLHICPSETEGFGHYIMEALAAVLLLSQRMRLP